MLSELSEKEIFEFSVNIKKEKFKKGETIIQIGTSNTKFYFILKGRVKLKEPKHKTTIRVYDQGNCFGEYSILYDKPNELSIVASENVICYTISKEAFLELLSNQKANDYMKEKMLLESYELKLKDLFYISYLGKGKFGNVYLVHNTMSFYAVKVISKTSVEKIKGGVQCLINEKKTMLKLDHPFIVKLVKTTKKEGLVFILQEYIKGINFEDYLQGRKNKHNLYEIKFYGACIFEMIGYLNRNKIVHRDIKPSNIMLESRGYLKLIDFGTARKLKNFTHTLIGTPNFIAPEILMGNGYSFSCDFWSIGIIIFYIYFGYLPFGSKAENLNDIYNDIIQREPEYPADTPFELKLILQNLLNKHPMQRITSIEGIKKESLFTDFPWDDLIKFKIKPPFIPLKDHRDSIDNLNNCNTTFEMIIESDKLDILQTKSLRNGSSSPKNFRRSSINSCWFNDF